MSNSLLRRAILAAADSTRVRDAVETLPVSRDVVRRFVGGTQASEAVDVCRRLQAEGLQGSVDRLGEDITDLEGARATRDAYVELLGLLHEAGLTEGGQVEVSLKLSAVGQGLGTDGPKVATEFAHAVCAAAQRAGTTVTLDAEDHTTTEATLLTVAELRREFSWVGAVVQSYLHRSEGDCVDLATAGSRVRLCKGAYAEPGSVAYGSRMEIDASYVRCLKVLMAGWGTPMVATHDPRLIAIAGSLASRYERAPGSYEHQLLYGIRPVEQRRLARSGQQVRVYVPFGSQWYGYLMRRLAERPANTMLFLRALSSTT